MLRSRIFKVLNLLCISAPRGRSTMGGTRFVRLELTDPEVGNKVLHAMTNDELNHIFETDGQSDRN